MPIRPNRCIVIWVPCPTSRGDWVCNSVWMLDDFTVDNGALRVVPGSHRWKTLPQDVLDDCFAAHPEQTLITGRAGSVVVMNAHIWHAGLENRTAFPRTARTCVLLPARQTPTAVPETNARRKPATDVISRVAAAACARWTNGTTKLAQGQFQRSGFLR